MKKNAFKSVTKREMSNIKGGMVVIICSLEDANGNLVEPMAVGTGSTVAEATLKLAADVPSGYNTVGCNITED